MNKQSINPDEIKLSSNKVEKVTLLLLIKNARKKLFVYILYLSHALH